MGSGLRRGHEAMGEHVSGVSRKVRQPPRPHAAPSP